MKVKNKNNSSIKTRNLIRQTFVELINEKKALSLITVTELVKRANINRGTFYTHYDSIYDVASEFQDEIINTLVNDDVKLETKEDIFSYFDMIFIHFKENDDIYKKLLSTDESLIFLNRLNKLINNKLFNVLKAKNITNIKLTISFFVDGITYQVLKYFKGSLDYTLDDIKKEIKQVYEKLF